MRTRSAAVDLTWNGAAVKSKMLGQTTEITYTDPASGEADSLDIAIHDRDRQWTVAWMPLAGDTLEAAIKLSNWEREGDFVTFNASTLQSVHEWMRHAEGKDAYLARPARVEDMLLAAQAEVAEIIH